MDRFFCHIRLVQDNMVLLENNLSKLPFKIGNYEVIRRSFEHDLDKVRPDLVNTYVEINKYHYNKKNDIENDVDMTTFEPIIEKHYLSQRHHFYRNDFEPNDIDVCEMCCDIDALSTTQKEEDNTSYFRNFMMKEYPQLDRYKKDILHILKLLIKLKKSGRCDVANKFDFINKQIIYNRKVQDNLVILEKNAVDLPFLLDDWELVRTAVLFGADKFVGDLLFRFEEYDNIEVNDINICKICCDYCARAWLEDENDYEKYCRNNIGAHIGKLDGYREKISSICCILKKWNHDQQSNGA
ncbi:MAG: DUF5662 family protein [Rickettsiales bacterium]|nr:DUF5662 family protein [Rickettsiales bacterium]